MSEPVITIPARKAIKIMEVLKYVDEINAPVRITGCTELNKYIFDELAKQCDNNEIRVAMVAAQIEG